MADAVSGGAPSAAPSAPSSAPSTPSAPSSSSAPSSAPSAPSSTSPASTLGSAGTGTDAATKPAAETPSTKRKAKIFGKEKEIDLNDGVKSFLRTVYDIPEDAPEDAYMTRVQKDAAADIRMQRVSEQEKRMQQALEHLRTDPFDPSIKEALGVDLLEQAELRLASKYRRDLEDQQLSPEQKAQRQYEEQLQAERSEKEGLQKQIDQQRQTQLDEYVFAETRKTFDAALSHEGLERSHETLQLMAEIARDNLDYDLNLSPSQMAAEVKERLSQTQHKLQKSVLGGLKGEKLATYLGQDVINEILRYSIEKAKGARVEQTFAKPKSVGNDDPNESKGYKSERASSSMQEWRKFLRE